MALIRCQKCSRTVLSAASQCPHCSRPMDPAQRDVIRDRRSVKWPSVVVIGAVLVLVIILLRNLEDAAAVLNAGPAPIPAPAEVSAGPPAIPDAIGEDATHAGEESAPESITPRDNTQNQIGQAAPLPASATPLWTSTWVNVRERPGPTSPVVRVLNPGQQVLVIHPQRGWSLVYVDDQRAGYLWVAHLADQPST